MRVIAGEARGRRIQSPPGDATRPITDRAKEAIFNMLVSLGGVVDAEVVDLYAGSGSFGLECLSRGASRVTFVEQRRDAVATIETNVESFGYADRATIVTGSVAASLPTLPLADLAFCDPPYADDPWSAILPELRADLLVGHAEHDVALTEEWRELRRRRYGRSRIVIARRDADR